jgi:hypothetical protein
MLKLVSLFKTRVALLLALALGAFVSVPAMAQSAIDPAPIVAVVSAQAGTIATIGAAILLLVVGIVAYRWVRRIIR